MTGNSYYLETADGEIEVSKGTYLTHLRKKKSTFKTVKKTKAIAHQPSQSNCKTIKKNLINSMTQSLKKSVKMLGKTLYNDRDIYSSVPQHLIPMEMDNDCESEWP